LVITEEGRKMPDGMPREIAISVMVSLAINIIRMHKGELSGKDLPDNPIALIALHKIVSLIEKAEAAEGTDKAQVH
jgi:hypothetical protein